ncbi:MAG TPA: hypothetical protein VIL49_12395 [Capillimicrobium sp.]
MVSRARRTALVAGTVTSVAGALLVTDPRRLGRPFGMEGREPALRLIGVSDLVLAPGLLRGEPRWPWLAARAAANAAVAAYLARVAPDTGAPGAVRATAAAMAALTVVDGTAGLTLRRAER